MLGTKTWLRDADHSVVSWDRVLIEVWRYTLTREAVAENEVIVPAFIAEQPAGQKISYIGVVEPTSPAPSRHARGDLSRFFHELAAHVNATVIVPEGGGLRGAVVRGVGVAVSTLAQRALPFSFADSVGSAATMIAPYLSPDAGGAAGLLAAIERARAIAHDAGAETPGPLAAKRQRSASGSPR